MTESAARLGASIEFGTPRISPRPKSRNRAPRKPHGHRLNSIMTESAARLGASIEFDRDKLLEY